MPYPYQSDAERFHAIRELYRNKPSGDVMFLVGIAEDLLSALRSSRACVADLRTINAREGLLTDFQDDVLSRIDIAITKAEGK